MISFWSFSAEKSVDTEIFQQENRGKKILEKSCFGNHFLAIWDSLKRFFSPKTETPTEKIFSKKNFHDIFLLKKVFPFWTSSGKVPPFCPAEKPKMFFSWKISSFWIQQENRKDYSTEKCPPLEIQRETVMFFSCENKLLRNRTGNKPQFVLGKVPELKLNWNQVNSTELKLNRTELN